MTYSKLYIAVLDEVSDFMVPTLVAHSILNAHMLWEYEDDYRLWFKDSFRKVVLRVNRKEFEKIRTTLTCWEGYENTILGGEKSCLVVVPMEPWEVPPVLSFAKMWWPREIS